MIARLRYQNYVKPVLTVAVSIPILATMQAAYFLGAFRLCHKDAPHPITPCRGIVISKSLNNDIPKTKKYRIMKWMPSWGWWFKESSKQERPLHLLVIGDSLAAGVGSISGTPVLPESIGKSLSAALGGIPVLWECHGTPGAITSHLLHDIEGLKVSQMTVRSWKDPFSDSNHSLYRRVYSLLKKILLRWMQIKNFSPDLELFHSRHHYDVVVILTGMNDLKTKFLPFMNSNDQKNGNGFYEMMKLIIISLRTMMKQKNKYNPHYIDTKKEGNTSQTFQRDWPNSVIVLPSFPTNPIPLLKYPPLCWILPFIFQVVDKQKYALSQEYSEDVLFVDTPSEQFMNDIENETPKLLDGMQNKTETLLLNLKDVSSFDSKVTKEKIQKHALKSNRITNQNENELYYEASLSDSLPNRTSNNHTGSKLISFDGIHPNNHGYDLWGRHIAENIIYFWKRHS